MSSILALLFGFLLFGQISGQSNNLDVNELEKKIGAIPGLDRFNSSGLPNEEDIKKVFKEKCEKNGANEQDIQAIEEHQMDLVECVQQYVNVTQIQEELEKSKLTGSMDEVLGKYCRLYPEIFECFNSSLELIKPCLDQKEKDNLVKFINVTNEVKEFSCFKDGDRIAMFIAEGGFTCLQERKDGLEQCLNQTLGDRIPTGGQSITSIPNLFFGVKECQDYDTIRKCFNGELEKCSDSTPANIIEAFFKFLRKHLPCESVPYVEPTAKISTTTNTATQLNLLLPTLLMVLFSVFITGRNF